MGEPDGEVDNSRFWLDKRDAYPDSAIQIIKNAPAQLTSTERFLLFTLVRSLSPAVVVEIGTFRGGSASIIAAALRSAQFGHAWCIDPNPKLAIAWSDISDHATLIQESSPEAFTTIARLIPSPIEFAFIDGDHSHDAVVRDTLSLISHLADNAWLLYHDAASHTVADAIDHCLESVPQLRDAGMLSRYFNADSWPGELFAGMRLLHFQRRDRFSWLPPSCRSPRQDLLPESMPTDFIEELREVLTSLSRQSTQVVGLYGLTARLAGFLGVLSEFQNLTFIVLEDDPILDGRVVVGWPILFAPSAVSRGIRDVIPMGLITNIPKERLELFRAHSINVIDTRFSRQDVIARPASDSANSSLDQRVFAATTHAFWYEGCRRFAFLGTDAKVFPMVGRFLTSQPYPNLIAMIDSQPSKPNHRWGIPVITWDEVASQKIDCIILPDASDESATRREIDSRKLSGIYLAIPKPASWWAVFTGSSR